MWRELTITRLNEMKIKVIEPNSIVRNEVQRLINKNDVIGAFKELVFNCVVEPNLKDKELQEKFSCVKEKDIVDKMFTLGELKGIADEIIKMSWFRRSGGLIPNAKCRRHK